jgi:hypothetical protein
MAIFMVDVDPKGHALIANILTIPSCHLLEVAGCADALKISHKNGAK